MQKHDGLSDQEGAKSYCLCASYKYLLKNRIGARNWQIKITNGSDQGTKKVEQDIPS